MDLITLFIGAFVTARLTRLVTTDRITQAPRHAALRKLSGDSLWAYLLICDWCVSVYAGLGVAIVGAVGGMWSWWWVLPLALTFSYAAGWLASKEGD